MSIQEKMLGFNCVLFTCLLGGSFTAAQTVESGLANEQIEFVTQTLNPTSATVQRPKDWFYAESHRGPALVWIISAEDTTGGKPYKTGVRIQSITGIKKIVRRSPAEFAKQQIKLASEKKGITVLSISAEKEVGPFKSIVLQTEESDNRVIYQFFWGADDLDRFVVVVSGTPKASWDANEPLLSKIGNFDLSKLMKTSSDVPAAKPLQDDLLAPLTSLGYQSVFMDRARSGHLTLNVRINDSEVLRFMCDSGANVSATTPRVSKLLKLEPKSTGSTISGVSGESEDAYRAAIESFRVGNHASSLSHVMILDLDQLNKQLSQSGSKPVDGILGSDWMRSHQAVIDVARRRLFFKVDNGK